MKADQLVNAEGLVRGYLNDHPSSAEAHFLLGYLLFRSQKAKESLVEFTAGAKVCPPSARELKIVASDYVILGDFEDARKWFTAVVSETPNDADAWYLLGRTEFNEDDFAGAKESFVRALSLRPMFIEAENNIGLSWRQLDRPDMAAAAFKNAIDWQGKTLVDEQPLLNMGSLRADQENWTDALFYLTQAVRLSPQNPTIHAQLARVYAAQQRLVKAQEELEHAISLAPLSSALHYKLAQLYRKEGLPQRAQQEFALCEKINSTHSSRETPNPVRPIPSASLSTDDQEPASLK